jgi:hypothetical protein
MHLSGSRHLRLRAVGLQKDGEMRGNLEAYQGHLARPIRHLRQSFAVACTSM